MSILDDFAMGFGVKDRDQDYYERTAETIRKDPLGIYRKFNFDPNEQADRYLAMARDEGFPVRGTPMTFVGPSIRRDLRDAVDGGGFGYGKSGDTFQGGPSSIFLNLLGIRPMGYSQRNPQMPLRAPMETFNVLPPAFK